MPSSQVVSSPAARAARNSCAAAADRGGVPLRTVRPYITRWLGFEVTYRYCSAAYLVRVDNSAGTGRGVRSVTVDGQPAARCRCTTTGRRTRSGWRRADKGTSYE